MTFFVTSVGPGKGGDLGGLAGADRHCQTLATAAGAGAKTWRAYLSTQGAGAVNARDRIGSGPWSNAKGTVIAKSLDELHSAAANLTKQTALTEKGEVVNGRGDNPNMHDVLTGSSADGRAIAGGRYDVQELDERLGRVGHARASRSVGRRQLVLERRAHEPVVQSGGPRRDGRGGAVLLLRGVTRPEEGGRRKEEGGRRRRGVVIPRRARDDTAFRRPPSEGLLPTASFLRPRSPLMSVPNW